MDKRDFQIRARFRHAMKAAAVEDGARLLVAVSGGCDSVSLLHLCLDEVEARGWRLAVGHVDHRLRPDSAGDAERVRALAHSLGLRFMLYRGSPKRWERLKGESIEGEARRLRRRGLRTLAASAGAGRILLGHTLDDQAETVLLNLLRGSGLQGMGGMAGNRPPWLRPLLRVPRGDLRDYSTRRGLAWREDPTNQDPRFLRNRVRYRLLPILREEFDPGVAGVLARTADTLRPLRRHLEAEAQEAWRTACREESRNRIRLERSALGSYHRAVVEEVLRCAFRRLRGSTRDLKRAHIAVLLRALRSGRQGAFSFPAGIEVNLNRHDLCLAHQTEERPTEPHRGA